MAGQGPLPARDEPHLGLVAGMGAWEGTASWQLPGPGRVLEFQREAERLQNFYLSFTLVACEDRESPPHSPLG